MSSVVHSAPEQGQLVSVRSRHAEHGKVRGDPARQRPHAHSPHRVIKHLTGKRERGALDGKRCLFEVLLVSHGGMPTQVRPVIVAPSSGGEARFGKTLLPDYPEAFSPGEYLVVRVTPV